MTSMVKYKLGKDRIVTKLDTHKHIIPGLLIFHLDYIEVNKIKYPSKESASAHLKYQKMTFLNIYFQRL